MRYAIGKPSYRWQTVANRQDLLPWQGARGVDGGEGKPPDKG